MKQYCLKDIHWIYTNDGKFVTPFIFNHNKTKIKDLANDDIIEISKFSEASLDDIQKIFAQDLRLDKQTLSVSTFIELLINNVLQLKSIKILKFAKLKHDLLKNGYSKHYQTFIVNEQDIKNMTKEIVQHFNPKTKLEKSVENLHNLTTNF